MSEPMPAPNHGGPEPGGDDKLPWLEPYREPRATPVPARPAPKRANRPRSSLRGGVALFAVFAALGLGAGGYWFGRVTAPHQVITPRTTVIAPLPQSAAPVQHPGDALPYRSLDEEPIGPADLIAPAPTTATTQQAVTETRSAPRTVEKPAREIPPPPPPAPPPPRPLTGATSSPQGTPPATGPLMPTPSQVTVPTPVPVVVHRNLIPSVGAPGEVIELGAFISRRTADAAFRRVVRRYPYLGTRPKAVIAFPRSGGWPPVYRLRLGTGSGRNANLLCRYVHSIGQRCAVV